LTLSVSTQVNFSQDQIVVLLCFQAEFPKQRVFPTSTGRVWSNPNSDSYPATQSRHKNFSGTIGMDPETQFDKIGLFLCERTLLFCMLLP
jgi:hypothetical protein